jgi:hypothetical protein
MKCSIVVFYVSSCLQDMNIQNILKQRLYLRENKALFTNETLYFYVVLNIIATAQK